MTNTNRAPKQWSLTKSESVTSYESWRQNILYTLALDANFAPFLLDGVSWEKKRAGNNFRGFTDDANDVPNPKTAAQKVAHLEMMLGQIANFCPVIARNSITKNAVSLNVIWQSIRQHFGFQSTGSHFLDFDSIKLDDERPEDLFQRLMAFVDDNLLKAEADIRHHNEDPYDEDITPTLENFVVLRWLQLIHPELPRLVKQRYGTELRSKTLATIKPEISSAMGALLEELAEQENAKISRSASYNFSAPQRQSGRSQAPRTPQGQFRRFSKGSDSRSCPLCKAAGREYRHFLSTCTFLPASDKQFMTKVRSITGIDESKSTEVDDYCEQFPGSDVDIETVALPINKLSVSRVNITASPYFYTYFRHHPLKVTLDTGAETNMIKLSTATYIGVKFEKSSQVAVQADGRTPLKIVAEAHFILHRGGHNLKLDALIVENLDVDVLGGIPFMELNDISVRPAKHEIVIEKQSGTSETISYGHNVSERNLNSVKRIQSYILRAHTEDQILWPTDYVELEVPFGLDKETTVAIEPCPKISNSCKSALGNVWPDPAIIDTVEGKVRLVNNHTDPILIQRNTHIANILPVISIDDPNILVPKLPLTLSLSSQDKLKSPAQKHSMAVQLDPDNIMPPDMQAAFRQLSDKYDKVFSPTISCYNGSLGKIESKVNMGTVLPQQRKGRVPQYSKNKLVELQDKFDELEKLGVFKRPEEVGICVEYLNPSFLVSKPDGGSRLVTAFTDIAKFSKPQPSLMPDVDSILRTIGSWKYIIKTDLSKAFFQIKLSKESLKYCGVATPFKGIRVYTRSAMGMPGSETALEELMCLLFGHLVERGVATKIADDLYCGSEISFADLLSTWSEVLEILDKSDLTLSPSKTVIVPLTTTILGWKWSQGTLSATSHRISTLATAPVPKTVKALRSYIGAYRMLSRVIKGCAKSLTPLEDTCSAKLSSEVITWDDTLSSAFNESQRLLSSSKIITLPKCDEEIWIVTDGSVKSDGIGSTMYTMRRNRLLLAGFFSAKLRKHQLNWLPCEIEALAIAASIKHFAPYLIQSEFKGRVLTDNKPCVQAYEKLGRGEFSTSPRVSTFLSTVSRYQVTIQHIAGIANLPSDFQSRNPVPCTDPCCQICKFIKEIDESVIRHTSAKDIISGVARAPFTSRVAWKDVQADCPDIRKAVVHLKQGTSLSKKVTNAKDIKRYMNLTTISSDNLLVRQPPQSLPIQNWRYRPPSELIVVPRYAISGLLMALHLRLEHPSTYQLKQVFQRYFFTLDLDNALDILTKACHTCSSLKHFPKVLLEQSSTNPPTVPCTTFSADIIKRNRQLILFVRETVTSFTSTCLVDNETKECLRDGLIRLCAPLKPLNGPPATIKSRSSTRLCLVSK